MCSLTLRVVLIRQSCLLCLSCILWAVCNYIHCCLHVGKQMLVNCQCVVFIFEGINYFLSHLSFTWAPFSLDSLLWGWWTQVSRTRWERCLQAPLQMQNKYITLYNCIIFVEKKWENFLYEVFNLVISYSCFFCLFSLAFVVPHPSSSLSVFFLHVIQYNLPFLVCIHVFSFFYEYSPRVFSCLYQSFYLIFWCNHVFLPLIPFFLSCALSLSPSFWLFIRFFVSSWVWRSLCFTPFLPQEWILPMSS